MSTAYTSLLGFALPVNGELSGTWGTTLNDSVTTLIEGSIAGTATHDVTAGDWTLTTTGSGLTNEARMATLIVTGTPGITRNIEAVNKSKSYNVVNNSNASVRIRGATGPTTGVLIASGTTTWVTWNGSDYVAANIGSVPSGTVTNINGIVKGNGSSLSAATSGTDYAPATSGTAILKGNGAGGFSAATANTDYLTATATAYGTASNSTYSGMTIEDHTTYSALVPKGGGMIIVFGNSTTLQWSPAVNNSNDLGNASTGWKNIYLNNSPTIISDSRDKNLVGSSIGTNFIMGLNPVCYTWKVGSISLSNPEDLASTVNTPGTRHHYGFFAQEVKTAVDNAGMSDFGGWILADKNDPNSPQRLRYEEFIAPMVKMLQEQHAQIIALQARVTALGG